MNDDAQEIRDLIASRKQSCPLVPMYYAETQGLLREKRLEHVKGEAAIFLRVGEDLVNGAISFSQLMNPSSENIFCWHLLQIAAEDPTLGSFYIDLPRNEAGDATYKRVVLALARRFSGIAEPADNKLCQKHVVPCHYVHRKQLEDVVAAMRNVQKNIQEGKHDRRRERNEKKSEAAPPAPINIPTPEDILLGKAPGTIDIFIPSIPAEDHPERILVNPSDAIPFSEDTPPVINKVTTTILECFDATGKFVGFLFRYCMHDERWNPGALVKTLIREVEERQENRGSSFYKDPRPHYVSLYGTLHPAHSMTLERWLHCVNKSQGTRPDFDQMRDQLGNHDRPERRDSPTNPLRVCTLSLALERARQAGAVFSFHNDAEWMSGTTARWPDNAGRVCRLLPEENYWVHTSFVGLSNRYFPFSESQTVVPEVLEYLKNTVIPTQDEIASRVPKINGVPTNNMLVLMANDADPLYDAVSKLKQGTAKYRKLLKETIDRQMQKFKMACVPDPTALHHLNLSNVGKEINVFFYAFKKAHETISRRVERADPRMSLFGNMIARDLLKSEKFGKVVQTLIPLKLRGCFSVYQRRLGQILYNLLVWGDFGKGKSFLTISFLKKFMIPGTFTQMDRATSASDQTDGSEHDGVRGYHEAPEHFISEKAARSKIDEVNLKKANMTDGTTTVNRAERKVIPGYGSLMVTKTSKRETNITEVWCSNAQPDEGALGKRLHEHLMLDSNIPTNELNYEVDTDDKKEIVTTFRVNQFLSYWIEKAMASFAIACRKPSMGLYHDISARMLECLKAWGVVSKRQSERALEIMEPMARQLTVEKAIMQTWHLPGAIHYGKQFEPEQLQDAAPFLWTNSEITLFTWTLHSSDWVRSEFGDILKALFRIAVHREYDAKETMYELFQKDVRGEIMFRRDKNWAHDPAIDDKSHRFHMDLNQIEIPGQHKDIVAEIATMTGCYSERDVMKLLTKMNERSFEPNDGGRNGYHRKMFADDLKRDHRATKQQKIVLNKANYLDTVRRLATELVDVVYLDICQRCQGLPKFLYRNLTVTKANDMFMGVSAQGLVLLHQSPEHVYNYAGRTTLSDAIEHLKAHATVSEETRLRVLNSFTDGPDLELTVEQFKILNWALELGWIMERNDETTTYFRIPIIRDGVDFPHFANRMDVPELKNKQIRLVDLGSKNRICFSPMAIPLFDKQVILDAFVYATVCDSTQEGKRLMGWVDERDISKLQTIDFTREFISEKVNAFDADSPANAVSRKEGIPFKRRQFVEESAASMLYGVGREVSSPRRKARKNVEVIRSLDEHAARNHYTLCGLDPNTAVVNDWEQYKGPTGNVDYPNQIIEENAQKSLEHWTPNAPTSQSRVLSRSRGAEEPEKKRSKNGGEE